MELLVPPAPDPAPEKKGKGGGTALFVFGFAALILILSCPPLRDWLVRQGARTLEWPKADRAEFVMWVEWVRIVLEVILAMAFSGLVFNKGLQDWSKNYAEKREKQFLQAADDAIKRDPTSKLYNDFRNELAFVFFGSKKDVFSIRGLFSVVKRGYRLSNHLTDRWPKLLVTIFWAWALRSFAGGLHGMWAAFSFLGILAAKSLKQLADSPVWVG